MIMDRVLKHVGTKRHSGRYPWGSGDNPEQRGKSFLGYVNDLHDKGMSDVDIAKGLGISTTQLRAKRSLANADERKENVAQAIRLKTKGMSNVAIGERMGVNESTVRSWLNPSIQERSEATSSTSKMLREQVDKKGFIDVGVGVERYLNVSRTKLKTAILQLEEEGYLVSYLKVKQLGTGKDTTIMSLSKPSNSEVAEVIKVRNTGHFKKETEVADIAKHLGMSEEKVSSLIKEAYSEVYKNKSNIKMIMDQHTDDGGLTYKGPEPIKSIDAKRVMVRYKEEGGIDKDGVIELRRGVEDLSLGNAKYAQVRIGVDGTHYLKGMAIYGTDIPKGYDVVFNTNKKVGTDKHDALKVMSADINDPKAQAIQKLNISKDEKDKLLKKGVEDGSIKPDPDNPFGATIKAGGQRGALNIVNEEGDWQDKWSKSLSSQMLSKQSPSLAQKQLSLTYLSKKEEYDEIMSLTNPIVKKRLLDSFADDCDSSAVHLKAAALPRVGWHVLLPVPTMKENEIYAPKFRDGEKVVIIRYPHGGTFEIPELTVNNRHAGAKSFMDQAKDAVGIHPKVAEKLSGADFDGDAGLVIPNDKRLVKTQPSLSGLKDFDPKQYKLPDDAPRMSAKTKGLKMGDVSNLITDMTIRGANPDEVARAVRHSMVVIDAEKHHLDYKKSYIDNGIGALKKRYQGGATSGASTLISKASSEKRVPFREDGMRVLNPTTGKMKRLYIDPLTGKKLYNYTGETYTDSKGKVHPRTVKSTKMAEEDDAFKLSSGTLMESVYASHANKLKALGNEARKASLITPNMVMSESAKKTYAQEVASLTAHLNIALKNAPLERHAQLIANTIVDAKKAANPDMDADDIKKINGQALATARARTGADKQRIDITEREWEAIQAGAVSTNTLSKILMNTDIKKVKSLATPRSMIELTSTKKQKAKLMLSTGYTQAEVADHLGVSVSTISKLK